MIDMALLSVLRRWHFRDGMPIREIDCRTGLSLNTVRKYLASGELEPGYRRSNFPSKLGDYALTGFTAKQKFFANNTGRLRTFIKI